MIWLISPKTSRKTLVVWEREVAMNLFFFHLKRFETLLKHQFQPRRDVIFVGKKILPKNGLPSPSGSPRTSHPRLHPCYVRRRPTDRSQFLCFFPVKPRNGWFHPKELVGFGMVLVGFWMVCFRCFSSFSENEKGVYFQVLWAFCFPGVWKIISYPLWLFFPGHLEEWRLTCWAKDGKTMKRKRLIINGQEIALEHIAVEICQEMFHRISDWLWLCRRKYASGALISSLHIAGSTLTLAL